jgi:hypothetical protein
MVDSARVRSVQHVITVAIGDEFPLEAAGQVQSRTHHADQLASCAQSDEDPRGVGRLYADIELKTR